MTTRLWDCLLALAMGAQEFVHLGYRPSEPNVDTIVGLVAIAEEDVVSEGEFNKLAKAVILDEDWLSLMSVTVGRSCGAN